MKKKPNDPKGKNDKNKKGKNDAEEEPEIDDSGPHIFEILSEEVKKNYIPKEKVEKAKLLDYTVGILHPDIITQSIQCRQIIDKIQKNNFEIFNFLHKNLTKEEIMNLYFKHTKEEYFQEIINHMTSGPVAILILINKEESYLDENGIKTLYLSPVERWKEMIGNKDPNVAKSDDENALRGIYGESIIKNGFWGSDNNSDAYRELSMFYLPLPSIPPKFIYDDNLFNLDTIIKFLLPPKPDHPDVSGRLDLICKYGPVVNHHVLDLCICTKCRKKVKEELKKNGNTLKKAKDKVLTDEFITNNKNLFCEECHDHFNKWSHVYGGLEGTHILTNQEIDIMIYDMNYNDLYEILVAEKGTSAKTIITKFDLHNYPEKINYTKEHVLKLISYLDVDYYDRYDFSEIQNLISEDRRIRLNYWISQMINKPIEQFPNPKLINFDGSEKQLKDIQNPHSKNFTLLRKTPIEVINKDRNKVKNTVLQHPMILKDKLTDHEINIKVEKLSQRNISRIFGPGEKFPDGSNFKANMLLLRNYELETIKSKEDQKEIRREKERLEQLKYQ